jgi:gluconate 2-dehydrogenase gamma chain
VARVGLLAATSEEGKSVVAAMTDNGKGPVTVKSLTRRDVLKSLTMGVAASSVLRVIPAEAAEYAHRMVQMEKGAASGAYAPKFFSAPQYKTLQMLCQAIIPPDDHCGGAIEAGAPEFIDLLTSESPEYQVALGGGIMWLDSTCSDRYGKSFSESSPDEQKQILDLIAYRKNAKSDTSVSQGVEFFSFLRNLTADGYFTSEIGIKDLQYIGNKYMKDFPGCPPVPEA